MGETKLISNFWQTSLVCDGDLDEAHPVVSLITPETTLLGEFHIAYKATWDSILCRVRSASLERVV